MAVERGHSLVTPLDMFVQGTRFVNRKDQAKHSCTPTTSGTTDRRALRRPPPSNKSWMDGAQAPRRAAGRRRA
eukprot:scaffold27784_cov66-Phaeocystis_antarctica.AAC.1